MPSAQGDEIKNAMRSILQRSDSEETTGIASMLEQDEEEIDRRVRKMIAEVDKDGNGSLDLDEFVEMMINANKEGSASTDGNTRAKVSKKAQAQSSVRSAHKHSSARTSDARITDALRSAHAGADRTRDKDANTHVDARSLSVDSAQKKY